jgi:hypothetical protein
MNRDEVLAWAGAHVRAPWEAFLRAAERGAGEVEIPLVRWRADYADVRGPLRDVLRVCAPVPPDLLTLVHENGKVIRAYIENSCGGELVAMRRLNLDGRDVRAVDAREFGGAWRKIADLRFFEAFARAGDAYGVLRAVQRVVRAGWIRFDPRPRGWRLLVWFSRVPLPRAVVCSLGRLRVGVALIGAGYVTVARFDPVAAGPRIESAPALAGMSVREVAMRLRARWSLPVLALEVGRALAAEDPRDVVRGRGRWWWIAR